MTQFKEKAQVMDSEAVARAINRIAHEILETNRGAENLALVGVRNRGIFFAQRLAEKIHEIEHAEIPVGALDVSFYRDDVALHQAPKIYKTELPFDVTGKTIILVDDVLFTGRTTRASMDAIMDYGRPSSIQLAVVVDRGHRELPIRADYVGKNIPTARKERVQVNVAEVDGEDSVVIVNWSVKVTAHKMIELAQKRERTLLGLKHKDLVSINQLSSDEITLILDIAESFKEISERPIKKVPTLRGRTVITLFFELSTRTRTSFELAAKRLSADTVNISKSSSAIVKGECIKDTAQTLQAMAADLVVIRHSAAGSAELLANYMDCSVINGGDGAHEHPTQALLDVFTIRQEFGTISGLKIAIVGDILHSRVARSNILALKKMGAEVVVVGPPTLMPYDVEKLGVTVSHDIDAVLPSIDVLYLLRIQLERQGEPLFPSLREYSKLFGINKQRLEKAKADLIVMHPGPINRGVEIAADIADMSQSLITTQVKNGVAIRMALLYLLLGGGTDE